MSGRKPVGGPGAGPASTPATELPSVAGLCLWALFGAALGFLGRKESLKPAWQPQWLLLVFLHPLGLCWVMFFSANVQSQSVLGVWCDCTPTERAGHSRLTFS